MDVRKLGRWLGRVAAVTAFGAGTVLGVSYIAAADEVGAISEGEPADAKWESEPPGVVELYDAKWE